MDLRGLDPYLVRLQCPSHWEVTEWARWQLVQRMRAQSSDLLDSVVSITHVITAGDCETHSSKSQG